MIGIFLALDIVLTIAVLVIRDQTLFRLNRLRAGLLALRSEEQRLGEERAELDRMIAQVGDALMRADRRRKEVKQVFQELTALLKELGVEVDEELALGSTSCSERNNC